MTSPIRLVVAAMLAAAAFAQSDAPIQDRRDPNQALRIPIPLGEGIPVARIYVHIANPKGSDAEIEALRRRLTGVFGILPGSEFRQIQAEYGVKAVQALPEVANAEHRLYQWDSPGELQVALIVRLKEPERAQPPAKTGLLQSGNANDIPRLYSSSRALLKAIVQPSLGFFLEQNVWLDNPESFTSGGKPRNVAWPEAAQELGIGGMTQLGSKPVYVYGAASYEWSTTLSQDTFQKGRVSHGAIELGYAGLLFAKPGRKTALELSAGRQSFSLNSNFLFGHVLGSTNGAYRGNSGLSPRNAFRMTGLARMRHGPLTVQGFYLEPNALDFPGQMSRYAGTNIRYNDNKNLDASFIYATSFDSEIGYAAPGGKTLSREGLRVVNPRLRWISALGVKGLYLEGEYAYEWNARFPMSAYGYGAWAGYTFVEKPLRPSLRYRYAYFTGDNPDTPTYERFDPLLGGVQNNWVQGLTMVKLFNNANIRSHRVEASIKPKPNLELLLDYHRLFAVNLNNLGGKGPLQTLRSNDIGHSYAPTMKVFFTKGLYIQALVDLVVPNEAIRLALPKPAKTWASYQLALYFGL
ncbi:MAG: alginate export family protein [Bryobacterales bacterium]|nr:alginate export family protein [Bryobacterales bacterium]